jgi:peptidylprolyl isomerase
LRLLALVGACLALTLAACGGGGSGQESEGSAATAEKGGEAEEGAAKAVRLPPRGPTVRMSRAEIAKFPLLAIPRPSGPPPHHFKIIDLRKGTGPGVPKSDLVTNREEVFIRYFDVSYPEAREGHLTGQYGPKKFLLEDTVKGVALGLTGMKVGGRRELIIPPKLMYPRWKPSWGYAPYVTVYLIDLLGMEPPADRRVEYRNRPFGHKG